MSEKKIHQIVQKIAREFKPEKVILFGSHAWGKPHENSDLDFFVVKRTKLPSLKRMEALDRLFTRREYPMDFLVYTPEQVKKRLRMGDVFVRDILTKGKLLYEKKNGR